LVIGFAEHLQIVTANNYCTFANSHTLQFTAAVLSLPSPPSSPMFSASMLTFTIYPIFWVNRPYIINCYLSEDWNTFILGLMYIPGKKTGLSTVAASRFQDRNVK
jgi:hypothetical protein